MVPPCPSIPAFHALLIYPGMFEFDAVNIAEGRRAATVLPFEPADAPWVDSRGVEWRKHAGPAHIHAGHVS